MLILNELEIGRYSVLADLPEPILSIRVQLIARVWLALGRPRA
jgi:hypothetical protein